MANLREFEERLIDAVAAHEQVNHVWTKMTDSQQLVAAHLMEGEKPTEIAQNLGISNQAVNQTIHSLKQLFKQAERQTD